ncbi:VOC family protein [Sphingobacterium sp. SRCM116780]|uniref:VOC family protein n=1 Tax=Sphingobacterium sp. SRCM116780 TaxID=2907623 RepID=UPI001F2D319E|nr:VOC family protein [Sphingobacterium sp. SRCM116780]UIR54998.1 VOC family protein [Sphingobacterium sp. SRCM116780]
MTTINPYLTFDGNCEEAFNFYKGVFKKEFQYVGRFGEMPPAEGQEALSPEQANRIMHVSLPIDGESVLMGSDSMDESCGGGPFVKGTNITLSINSTETTEADRLYAALSTNGAQTMPMSQTFWGAYFGMLTDQFGIHWMINVDVNPHK